MSVAVTTNLWCLHRLRLVCYVVLSTLVVNPCLGEDDSHHPPLVDNSLTTLDIGFKSNWKPVNENIDCIRPCFSFAPDITEQQAAPDQTINYKQDFRLELGETGPLSFRLTGRHLKMRVEF